MQHIDVAKELQQWGLFDWTAQEYRHIIEIADKAGAPSDEGLAASSALSELLHEQGDDLAAAEVLQGVVKKVGAAQPANAQVAKRTLGEIQAQMNFYFAAHWKSKNDTAKTREYP